MSLWWVAVVAFLNIEYSLRWQIIQTSVNRWVLRLKVGPTDPFFGPKTIPKFPTIEFTLFFISLFIFLFSFEIGNKILITLFQILLNFQLSDFFSLFFLLGSNYSENESMLSFQYYVNGKGRTWKKWVSFQFHSQAFQEF